MKGSIIVDEVIIPIVDIYVDDGKFVITAETWGPVRAVTAESYVVCDRRGSVVYRTGPGMRGLAWEAIRAGGLLTVTVALSLEGQFAAAAGETLPP